MDREIIADRLRKIVEKIPLTLSHPAGSSIGLMRRVHCMVLFKTRAVKLRAWTRHGSIWWFPDFKKSGGSRAWNQEPWRRSGGTVENEQIEPGFSLTMNHGLVNIRGDLIFNLINNQYCF